MSSRSLPVFVGLVVQDFDPIKKRPRTILADEVLEGRGCMTNRNGARKRLAELVESKKQELLSRGFEAGSVGGAPSRD